MPKLIYKLTWSDIKDLITSDMKKKGIEVRRISYDLVCADPEGSWDNYPDTISDITVECIP